MIKYPKKKGKRLEERVANIIKNLWNINEDDRIHRAFTSGVSKIENGDIKFNLKEKLHLWIECKNREDWNENNLLDFNNRVKQFFKKIIKEINKKKEPYLPVLIMSKAFSSNIYCITIQDLFLNETFLNKCNLYLDNEEFKNYNFIINVKINKKDIFEETDTNILEDYLINKNSNKVIILVIEIHDFFKSLKPLII